MRLIIRGAEIRADREHNGRAWLAWHVAALERQHRLPELERLLVDRRHKSEVQSWEEMDAAMSKWAFHHNRAIAVKDSMRGQK